MRPRVQPTAAVGLQAQAEEQANGDHNRRIAELQALGPLLAQLDKLTPALAAKGLQVRPFGLALYHHHVGPKRFKVLRVDTRGMCDPNAELARKWQAALAELGFVEVERDTGTVYPTTLLRRGQLLLRVDAAPQVAL